MSSGGEIVGGGSSGMTSGPAALSAPPGTTAGGVGGATGGMASKIRSGINRMVGQHPPGHTEKTTLLSSDDEFQ